MDELVPKGKTRLLLVEGQDDVVFFLHLIQYLRRTSAIPRKYNKFHVISYGSRNQLSDRLIGIVKARHFKQVKRIGIVGDADNDLDAFQQLQKVVKKIHLSKNVKLVPPSKPLILSEGHPAIAIFVVPAAGSKGSLEDVVLRAVCQDKFMPCVEKYLDCLQDSGLKVRERRKAKSKLSVFLSGKVLDSKYATRAQSRRLPLRAAVVMKWWNAEDIWQKGVFNDAKTFLRQLLD